MKMNILGRISANMNTAHVDVQYWKVSLTIGSIFFLTTAYMVIYLVSLFLTLLRDKIIDDIMMSYAPT